MLILRSFSIFCLSLAMLACAGEDFGADLNYEEILDGEDTARLSLLKASSLDVSSNIVECQTTPERFPAICMLICHRPPGNPLQSKTKVMPLKAIFAHLVHGGKNNKNHDYMGECLDEDHDEDAPSDDSCHGDHGSKDHVSKDHSSSDDNSSNGDSLSDDSSDSESDHSQSKFKKCQDDNTNDSTSEDGDTSDEPAPSDPSGDEDTTGEGDVGNEEPPLPLWCSENLYRDSDCDGLDDSTGSPIY